MPYNFDSVPQRRASDSLKWRKYAEDVLPMWVADMDFVTPEPVVRALRQRVEQGFFGYPEGVVGEATELVEFRRLIVDRMAQHYHWSIQPHEMIFLPGVVTAFNVACHAFATPGSGVLVQPPVYPPMLSAPQNARLLRQDAALTCRPDGSYAIDWTAFEAALTPETCLFLLCNPHNPVGRVYRRDELERMAEICLRHNIVICSDEIHCDLIYRGQPHIPIASLDPEIARRTITLIAPSKTFNLAGLQCSIAIIQDPELRRKYLKGREGLVEWVNLMGLLAGEVAYREGQEWLDQLLVYLEANRDFVYDYVGRELPMLKMAKPEGTYLAWLDCRSAGLAGNPAEFFLQKARVALSDCAAFGPGGEGYVRLNFGCPRSMLLEALERMKQALK